MTYKFVNYLWDDAVASKLNPADRLVYRSNLLGSDQRITNTGGGNTSSKITEKDPLTGGDAEVLWVKGSGGDLRTSKRENFSSLYQQKLLDLQKLYAQRGDKGVKSQAEDDMVAMYFHTTFNLNPRAPARSIRPCTASFLASMSITCIPNAIISVAASRRCEELTKEIFGDEMDYVPWMRPGFELGLAMQDIVKKNPGVRAIMMGQHGFISWQDDDKLCYEETLRFIEKASQYIEEKYQAKGGDAKAFGGPKYQTLDEASRRATFAKSSHGCVAKSHSRSASSGQSRTMKKSCAIVNSNDAPRLVGARHQLSGSFSAHKDQASLRRLESPIGRCGFAEAEACEGLVKYRQDYADYYERCKHANSPAMRDPNPTVILIPGLGMIAWGKDKSESRVTAEFYNCAVEVMRGAEAIDEYIALPQQEAFDIEYWLLEEAKLQRMPAEKELARQVIVVIGAGSGIGKETAHRLVKDGAHIVSVDLNKEAAESTAREIESKYGTGIGVAGTGISGCGPAIGLAANITDRKSIRDMLDQVALAYGGFDSICVTAGIFVPSDTTGHIPDDKWALTFNINVTGSYLVGDEAAKTWKEQGLRGKLVLTSSANAAVAKKGSVAYDTSKAAANHLVRELAIELAPLVRVNGVAPATVVKGSAMFPRDRVIGSLAKYNIPYDGRRGDRIACE